MITSFSLVQFKPFTLHKLNKRVFIFFCCCKIFSLNGTNLPILAQPL